MTAGSFIAYHGSLRRFEAFSANPARRMTASPTAKFGTFCVADPKIAAHFTLRPHVISEGYASPQGSRILRDDPWWVNSDPFEMGASVAEVTGHLHNPKVFSAKTWSHVVHLLQHEPHIAAGLHELWRSKGHDGLLIEAWDQTATVGGHPLSVETDATTWVVFDSSALVITRWFDAINAWT